MVPGWHMDGGAGGGRGRILPCRPALPGKLNVGDMMVVGPNAGVVFRASQLGVFKLEYFQVLPAVVERIDHGYRMAAVGGHVK